MSKFFCQNIYPLISVDLSHSALRKFLSLVVESNFHVSVYTHIFIYIYLYKKILETAVFYCDKTCKLFVVMW